MKMRVTVEIFDEVGAVLSKQTQESIELSQQMKKDVKSNMEIREHQRISSFTRH